MLLLFHSFMIDGQRVFPRLLMVFLEHFDKVNGCHAFVVVAAAHDILLVNVFPKWDFRVLLDVDAIQCRPKVSHACLFEFLCLFLLQPSHVVCIIVEERLALSIGGDVLKGGFGYQQWGHGAIR
jgi:hypothetical protein